MDERIPIDRGTLSNLINTPIIIRVVTVLDVTSLSILELFEYNMSIGDIIYSMANGIIVYDNLAMIENVESVSGVPPDPNQYLAFIRRKVKLTQLGLYILELLKGEPIDRRSSVDIQHEYPDTDPRQPPTI